MDRINFGPTFSHNMAFLGDIDLHLESCLKPKWEKKKIPKRHSRSLELGHKCQRKNKYINIYIFKSQKN